mgnify:CR=1 FL=1
MPVDWYGFVMIAFKKTLFSEEEPSVGVLKEKLKEYFEKMGVPLELIRDFDGIHPDDLEFYTNHPTGEYHHLRCETSFWSSSTSNGKPCGEDSSKYKTAYNYFKDQYGRVSYDTECKEIDGKNLLLVSCYEGGG